MRSSTLVRLFVFCIILLTVRIFKTEHYSFLFLIWNLFLAWLPYKIIFLYEKVSKRSAQFLIIGLTILFLPNAPYILTDLFHLTKNLLAPMWFDLVLILSFALLGLIFFIATADRLFTILRSFFKSDLLFNSFKFLVILSNGYGIYLGRYLRFNSWDLLSHPGELFWQMYYSVFDKSNVRETISVTVTFTIFLYLVFEIYESFKRREEAKQNELL